LFSSITFTLFYLANNKTLPACPFGATCYRKNLLHFAEFNHPFNLLNPDADSDDEEEETNKSADKIETKDGGKKRKAESQEYTDGEKTEEYNSDDVS